MIEVTGFQNVYRYGIAGMCIIGRQKKVQWQSAKILDRFEERTDDADAQAIEAANLWASSNKARKGVLTLECRLWERKTYSDGSVIETTSLGLNRGSESVHRIYLG
jgi:hypothetical protein